MSTRVGQLFCATNAEKHLRKLLNVNLNSKEIWKKNDLKNLYIKAISRIHPDRAKNDEQRKEFHSEFITLRQAWDAYDKGNVRDRTSKKNEPGNFVKFGGKLMLGINSI